MLQVRLLGEPLLLLHGSPLPQLGTNKAKGILFYLLSERKVISREALAALFWHDKTKDPLNSLRAELPRLRRHLAPYLVITDYSIAFNQQSPYWLDLEAFENKLEVANPTVQQLHDAVELYHGEFLSFFAIKNVSPEFEHWLTRQREYFRVKMREACRRLLFYYREQQHWSEGLRYAQRLLTVEDWTEEHYRWVMEFLAHLGNTGEALAQYEICVQKLAEMDETPSHELIELYERIARGDGLTTITSGFSYSPSGQSFKPPFQVPARLRYFIGRAEILQRVGAGLRRASGVQPQVLVGMGGIGKSALAIELGHRLVNAFPDGILWADASASTVDAILDSWAQEYDHDFSRMTDVASKAAAFRSLMANKQVLMILNDVVTPTALPLLLPNSRGCAILITTRDQTIATALDAEVTHVPEFTTEEGCQLLSLILNDEARIAYEREAAIAICHLVQDLPLALEILAKQLQRRPQQQLADLLLNLQTTQNLLGQLRYGHSEVSPSFQLSYDRLPAKLQSLYVQLAVFEGRAFPPKAVEAILEQDRYTTEEQLLQLADLSLLQETQEYRYRQHALLAEFSQQKFNELPTKASVYRRMVNYFAQFAQEHASRYTLLEREQANLLPCTKTAFAQQMWPELLLLAKSLTAFWFAHGHFSEARQVYAWAVAGAAALGDEQALALFHCQWGRACLEQAADEESEHHLAISLAAFRLQQDEVGASEALFYLGRLALERKEFEQGNRWLEESRVIRERHQDLSGVAHILYLQADRPFYTGDYVAAKALGRAAFEQHSVAQNRLGMIQSLGLLADIAIAQEQNELAQKYCQQALTLCHELNEFIERAVILYIDGEALRRQGKLQEAKTLLQEGVRLFTRMGDQRMGARTHLRLSKVYFDLNSFDLTLTHALASQEINTMIHNDWGQVYTLEHLGNIYRQQGQATLAGQQWEAAFRLAEAFEQHPLAETLKTRLT